MCFCMLLAAALGTSTIIGYIFLAAVILGLCVLSDLPIKKAAGSLRQIRGFLIVIFLMNSFFYNSLEPIWSWWILNLSAQGMVQGANVVLRVIFLMFLGSLLLATTPPQEITSALSAFLKPLAFFHVPVGEVSMILSAAMQFLPVLTREADLIKKAQIARGARFESRNPLERAASYLPLLIPIFLSAFRRADELALAMEARGYQSGNNPVSIDTSGFHKNDFAALAGSAVVCVLQFTCFH